ncbi:MAG: PIN domain-containing protein, partial [Actinomycetota bacterium]
MVEALGEKADALVVSPYVIAELDYLAATLLGVADELAILDELTSGAYVLPGLDAAELRRACRVIERFADQQVGLADASLVVLADRYRTKSILTLDRRHLEILTPLSG